VIDPAEMRLVDDRRRRLVQTRPLPAIRGLDVRAAHFDLLGNPTPPVDIASATREVRMLRFAVIVALAIATPTLTPVLAADPATKQASAPVAPTATFVAQAAFGNIFEIESSKLALDRSKAGPVKGFAQRMLDDHSAAAVKFKEAVLEAKLTMPPDKLDAKHQAIVDELTGKQGGVFDKAYIEAQYKAHVETVDLFKGYAQGGEDTRMRAFAAELLPTLQAHLEHVGKMR
jgi:putative membrane protein